ncbi:MAG TPA: response regulator transcription factor [Bacteroidales bacterium]|nr:response regulator transcription factor [Bacteroidales bacterium]
MIRCIAVDDEPLALELIRDYTERIPFLKLEGLFESGIKVLEWLHNNQVDVIFLDIMMPEITGIQFIEVMHHKPMIVFTTAYEEYGVQGFDLDIVDYLLKPISFDRFLKAVLKVQDRLKRQNINSNGRLVTKADNYSSDDDFMFIRTEGRHRRIDFNSIYFIEGMKDYLRIHTDKGRIMTLMTFREMLKLLPANRFIRIHRSYIVHLSSIEAVESKTVIIKEQRLPLSKIYRDGFFSLINSTQIMSKGKKDENE